MRIPEVLSPAGSRESLEAAVRYGADAVYLASGQFGMRASAENFGGEGSLSDAVSYAHRHGVRVYLTCNTLPTNEEIDLLPQFFEEVKAAGVDALIIADIGVLMQARRSLPDIPIHISTQAGVVNYLAATELYHLGATRIVLARELSLEAIKRIRDKIPPELELEAFVHGAMCMSFSGRCLISNYMMHRDANRGECSQPCRWGYYLVEEKRPGQLYPVFEDERGSYILNAQDLSMIAHIEELADAGIDSLKIEGRAKSAFYVASVTNAYRAAADAFKAGKSTPQWALDEVMKVSHREYSTGFYFDKPSQCFQSGGYIRNWEQVANIDGYEDGMLRLTERNHFAVGDVCEAMLPGEPPVTIEIKRIIDAASGEEVARANHPMHPYLIPYHEPLPQGAMLRREANHSK